MREIELTENMKKDPTKPFTPRNIKGWHCVHTERSVFGFWEATLNEDLSSSILDKPVTRAWVTDRDELQLDVYPHTKTRRNWI